MQVTDEMVSRFLCWRLPATFAPDCGISFDGRKDDKWNKNKTWPIGTNLLTAIEARAMLEHVIAEPAAQPHVKTAAEMRYDAAHDTSCVGAFARARPPLRKPVRCPLTKMGEYNKMQCCYESGHKGVCNWVVTK